MTAPLLALEGVAAAYGRTPVLFGVDLTVPAGEVVALMGRNGMGKTTTVRTIMGLMPATAGRVVWRGRDLAGLAPHRIAHLGLGLVPEGRRVFPTLTVRETLVATARPPAPGSATGEPWTLDRVHGLFPRLAERADSLGGQLSGGEQQMLAIGRALMTNPALLILDEATEGLAPVIRDQIWAVLGRLKAEGLSILVIDKTVSALARVADRMAILEKGRVVWTGTPAALLAAPDVQHRHLGV
ncbi:ABC transporter ATP-binding protein [Roseospira goensis]|uniref:Branched-chain amino acid transport system ATP-binding protein n=1 Tax=Roseospira goensis TaxID=391922 RepID=A0A7W6S1T5_9PROT|nr:ABC transporter ATP-binding protein [Roseospira goensis]MBB4287167.1 branched-chain amino acid transport system ATP-binding protein [Roseospira goensis]